MTTLRSRSATANSQSRRTTSSLSVTPSPCRNCQHEAKCCTRRVGNKPWAIVLDFPTTLEARKGKLLEGDTGRLIRATCKSLDIAIEDFHVLTALNCKPPGAKPKVLRDAMACCRARLLRELRHYEIEKVICTGTVGYTALTSTEKIARMTKVHCRWMPVYGMQMLGTYAPSQVLADTELFRDFHRAFEKFVKTDRREPWPQIRVHKPQTGKELRERLDELDAFTRNRQLSLDIETTGFSYMEDRILAIGFGAVTTDGSSSDVIILDEELLELDETWQIIADQLEFGWTTLHNGKFDLQFIIHQLRLRGIEYRFGWIDDTMLLNYCLDERPMGRYAAHSLKNVSRVRYDAPDYDIEMGKWLQEYSQALEQEDWERVEYLLGKMHEYLALDCYYTARLGQDLRSEVSEESERLLDFYEWLLIEASLALTDIEYRGCKVNRPYLEKMDAELEKKEKRLLAKIQKITGNSEFNPGSSKQMYNYLYVELGLPVVKTKRKGRLQEGPTSRPMLDTLRHKVPEHREFLETVVTYRQTIKIRGTYIHGLLDRLDENDRIRSSYFLHGTATGRISSTNPNLQNIPDKSYTGVDLRAAYIPTEPDWFIIEADYSQLELRVVAHLSGDKNLTKVYIEDGDLHDDVSEAVYHRRETSVYERWLVKRLVFGTLYGRGAESLANGPEMEYVESELGGKRWTLEETEVFFKRFFSAYPELKAWQENQAEIGYRNQRVETLFGRFRRFPFIGRGDNGAVGRQSMNTPIQSTASDITLSALVRIHKRLTKLNNSVGEIVAHVVLTVHDSITTECHPDYLDEVLAIIDREMKRVPLDSKVPFKASIGVGRNWGACK